MFRKFNWVAGAVIVISFGGCNDSNKSTDTKKQDTAIVLRDTVRAMPDSIHGRDIERDRSLPENIPIDSTIIEPTKYHTGIHVNIPVIPASEHSWLNKELAKFKRTEIQDFLERRREEPGDTVFEEYGILQGWSMWVGPLSLYKTDSVISFILQSSAGYTAMPSGYWFPTFNYDNRTRKPIRFADYFIMDTPADSMAWVTIVSKASGRSIEDTKRMLQYDGKLAFGFDKDNVYLCFEKYHIYNYGIIPIKKSFFITSIRSVYREM